MNQQGYRHGNGFVWHKLLFLSVTALVFAAGTYPQLEVGDYKPHIAWARQLTETGSIPIPHVLFQQIVIILRALLPSNILSHFNDRWADIIARRAWDIAGLAATVLIYLATAAILYWIFSRESTFEDGSRKETFAWTGSLASLLVMPILLFTLQERLILGYLPPNVLHNATYILSRVFALPLFYLSALWSSQKIDRKKGLVLASLAWLSTAAKPNFVLAFLPALLIFLWLQAVSLKKLNWTLFWSVSIPTLLTLAWQYLILSKGATETQFVFAPFMAIRTHVSSLGMEMIYLLLSLAFPISVAMLNWQFVRQDPLMQLLALCFISNLGLFYFFAEVPKTRHLNLIWGSMLCAFLAFVFTLTHWFKAQFSGRKFCLQLKTLLPLSLLVLHLISGGVYYITTLLYPGPVR